MTTDHESAVEIERLAKEAFDAAYWTMDANECFERYAKPYYAARDARREADIESRPTPGAAKEDKSNG